MRIGVPKEITVEEYRVGMTPAIAHQWVLDGAQVMVETHAGAGLGYSDGDYQAAGATVLPTAEAVFASADLIVKVKEPQAAEIALLQPRHLLFTYLHLAADKAQAEGLMASGCTAIAYETVTDRAGRLPLLAPMSQVAGRMAVDVGANALLRPNGGRGLLLGGVPGVAAAKVVILGGGVAGVNAAQMAVGHHAQVSLFDISLERLAQIDAQFGGRVTTLYSEPHSIANAVAEADLVIGCVLVPGAAAPKLVTRAVLGRMQKGAVLVDVAIDQGGCFETSHPTTHTNPTFVVDGVVHYCVANMPGAAPLTSTHALTAATAPYIRALAAKGLERAMAEDAGLGAGLNVRAGKITHAAVAAALGL